MTRLTAEQFFATFTGREYDGHYGELDVFAFAEAFRDKSEAGLRAKLADETFMCLTLRQQIEQLMPQAQRAEAGKVS